MQLVNTRPVSCKYHPRAISPYFFLKESASLSIKMSEPTSEFVPEHTPENSRECTPECVVEDVPEDVPEPENTQECAPEDVPANHPAVTPEDKPSEPPKYGLAEDGSYITPYSCTLVYRDKHAISEAISGVFEAGGATVQRAILSPVAPTTDFWTLCDHPSESVLFLDIPAEDAVVEFARAKGFQSVYFVAGEHCPEADHAYSYPLEFIHTRLPRRAMFLAARQYIEMVARARIPRLTVSFIPPKPTIGSPVASSLAPDLMRGIEVLGLTCRSAGAKVVSSVIHAEEYIRDWIAAGIAAKTLYRIMAERKMATAARINWQYPEPTGYNDREQKLSDTIEVITVVSDELHPHILEEAVNTLKDTPNPVALLVCFPGVSGWNVRAHTLKLGALGESCGGVFEELAAQELSPTLEQNTYSVPTRALAKFLPVLGE